MVLKGSASHNATGKKNVFILKLFHVFQIFDVDMAVWKKTASLKKSNDKEKRTGKQIKLINIFCSLGVYWPALAQNTVSSKYEGKK